MDTRQKYIDTIKQYADVLEKRFGISYMCLFGSVARGDQHEGSDVDLFVEMPAVYYNYAEAADFLEDLLGCKVDLVRNREGLRPFFRKQIERDGITIFRAA